MESSPSATALPDLNPRNYHLFWPLQNFLNGKTFASHDELKTAVGDFSIASQLNFTKIPIYIIFYKIVLSNNFFREIVLSVFPILVGDSFLTVFIRNSVELQLVVSFFFLFQFHVISTLVDVVSVKEEKNVNCE